MLGSSGGTSTMPSGPGAPYVTGAVKPQTPELVRAPRSWATPAPVFTLAAPGLVRTGCGGVPWLVQPSSTIDTSRHRIDMGAPPASARPPGTVERCAGRRRYPSLAATLLATFFVTFLTFLPAAFRAFPASAAAFFAPAAAALAAFFLGFLVAFSTVFAAFAAVREAALAAFFTVFTAAFLVTIACSSRAGHFVPPRHVDTSRCAGATVRAARRVFERPDRRPGAALARSRRRAPVPVLRRHEPGLAAIGRQLRLHREAVGPDLEGAVALVELGAERVERRAGLLVRDGHLAVGGAALLDVE